ncbi:phage capsid and scaffold protein [Aurantimonas sp. 22II-16-19i]|nr:phage capsid and scaffold protein [Aurantimonas sp. 22II-16-19i]
METPPLTDFYLAARAKLVGRDQPGEAVNFAKSYRASDRALALISKATVTAATTDDAAGSGNLSGAPSSTSRAFLASLQNRSFLMRMAEDRALRPIPNNTQIAISSVGFAGFDVSEGRAVPVSKLQIGKEETELRKAMALIVASNELARAMSSEGQALFNRELAAAVADAIDGSTVAELVDSGTPSFVSSGNDATSAAADLRALVMSVSNEGDSKPYFIFGTTAAKAAATLYEAGQFVFPAMSSRGGEVLNAPALVSSSIAADSVMLIDGNGIGATIGEVEIDFSEAAAIEMVDSTSGSSVNPTAVQLVSMFQNHSTCLRAVAYFNVKRLRDDALAVLTDVAWGGPAS